MNRTGGFRASPSLKKRPAPPSAPGPSAKRPKQGPFVTESDSEDDSGRDYDDEYNDEGYAALTPERIQRRSMGERDSVFESTNNGLRPASSLQRQGSSGAFEDWSSVPGNSASRAGRSLNKNRLGEMLLAKKQGRSAGPGVKSISSLSLSDARNSPRVRPLNDRQAVPFQREVSRWPGAPATTHDEGALRHTIQNMRPGQSEGPLRGNRNQTQDTPNNGINVESRADRAPTSALNPKTSLNARKVSPQNAANTSFWNDTLNSHQTACRGTAQEPDVFGSGRKEALSYQIPSARPEVGARHRHTIRAGKSNMQDRVKASATGAPATTGVKNSEISVSWDRTAFPARSSASVSKQAHRQIGDPKPRSAPDRTPDVNHTPVVDLRQSTHNSRKAPVINRLDPRRLPLEVSSGKTHLTRAAPGEQTNVAAHGDLADTSGCTASKSQSTKSNATSSHGEILLQKKATRAKANSSGSHDTLPLGSTSFVRVSSTTNSEAQSRQSPNCTDAGRTGSSEVPPSQQHGADVVGLGLRSDSCGRLSNAEGCEPKRNSEATAAALSHKSTVLIDFCAPITAPDSPPAVPGNPSTRPRVPVAVMVRPDILVAQTLTTHGTERCLPLGAPVVGSETAEIASRSDALKGLQPFPCEQAGSTSIKSSADSSRVTAQVSDAATPRYFRSDQSDSPVLKQVIGRNPVPSRYNAVSDDASVPADLVEKGPVKPVACSTPRQHASASLASKKAHSSPGSRRPSLGVDVESAPVVPSHITAEASSPHPCVRSENSTDTEAAPIEISVATSQSPSSRLAADITLLSSPISPTAEPYFEYSIHQNLSSPQDTTTTELSAQPFTSLNSANARADDLFQSAKTQYKTFGMQCTSTTTSIRDNGLSVLEATFISIYDPSKTLTLKLWVARAEVGIHANHTPSSTPSSPLISKTLYAVRLWRLAEESRDSDSDTEPEAADSDSDSNAQSQQNLHFRIYHPLPQICTEIHTTLPAANHAAKRVQIALSHEAKPKSMQAKWQTDNLRELNMKLEGLSREVEDEDGERSSPSLFEYVEGRRRGCWRSTFNGSGLGGWRFELLVVRVGVSGPRNL